MDNQAVMNGIPALAGGKPIRSEKIFYAHQQIDQADIDAVVRVLKSDYLTCGPAIDSAERALCDITGAKYAVLCSSGTAALHIACMAAGIGEGDEVITTPITFAASANCVRYCGGKPVFADIDPATYQLDPAKAAEKITDRTKAIIPVDFGGGPADIDVFRALAKAHGLTVIEDASHAIGTKLRERCVGTLADMTVFSFHPVKTICGGEGGAVMTDSEELYRKLILYRTHGITRDTSLMRHEPDGPWYYEQLALSTNYRITDMQAALIESQLKKLSQFAARRDEIRRRYDEAFGRLPQLFIQQETPGAETVRHLYILRIVPEKLTIDRRGFYDALMAENIVPNVHYVPVYYFPYYESLGYERGLCPEAERLYDEMLTIPLYAGMTDDDVESVIEGVTRIANYYSR